MFLRVYGGFQLFNSCGFAAPRFNSRLTLFHCSRRAFSKSSNRCYFKSECIITGQHSELLHENNCFSFCNKLLSSKSAYLHCDCCFHATHKAFKTLADVMPKVTCFCQFNFINFLMLTTFRNICMQFFVLKNFVYCCIMLILRC